MPAQFVNYQTAKAAVVTLSEAIRAELAEENIGVFRKGRGGPGVISKHAGSGRSRIDGVTGFAE
jgi:NAD(P)-dependent dehydrogenase (short-subunit alcohol dehydrogenase family)